MTPEKLQEYRELAVSMVTPHTRYILYQLIDEIDKLRDENEQLKKLREIKRDEPHEWTRILREDAENS